MQLTLIQIPWSPFCIGIRQILKHHRVRHRVVNIPPYGDRAAVIRATKGRGATVPCLLANGQAIVDETDWGQEVARFLDDILAAELFPTELEGHQQILARYIENDCEAVGFKVNDSYVLPTLPLVDRVNAIRWKERKFGKGCVEQWTRQRAELTGQFTELLRPLDNMLARTPYLLDDKPRFVDYDLFGIVGNFLYAGKTRLPAALPNLRRWHKAMS